MYITYFETSDSIRKYNRTEWRKIDLLTNDQRDILQRFLNSSDENIMISKTHDFSAGNYENTSSSKAENKDIEAKLIKLRELKQKDLITQEEYDKKKRKLLEDL